jgi:HD-GYP domain-containing protein (c-di-GMP phosphodiesterase class II)
LRDEASGTLRQVAAVGPLQPSAQPLPLDGDDALAQACATGEPRIAALARLATGAGETTLWRHAFPVSATSADGAVGIDVRGTVAPDAALINSILASLRGSFAAALVQHVARTEIDAAQRLLESARELSRILDEEQVLERALAQAMALSDAATGSVMLLDEDTGRLTIAISRGLPDDVVRTTSLAEGEGIAGWVLATAQPLLVEDLPARAPAARRHGVRSAVSVPIADDDGVLGVLNVGSKSFPARFSRSHLNAIEVLGKQTATALRNARAVRRTRALYFDTLTALALALETKDPYSRGGTKRVVDLALALGRCFDLEPEDAEALHVAALVHDLGMVVAGESVATAARPLSTVERALIKMHPRIAAEMLAEAPALERVVPIVYHHHEWYDAGGYASGLAGERIPLGARILAVADAYVAMTSPRPYRPAATEREALRELSDKAGTQFDPDVVEALKQLLEGRGERVPPSGAADR